MRSFTDFNFLDNSNNNGDFSQYIRFYILFNEPILNLLTSTPTMAIIILALIWLDNEIVPMFVGFIMVFPILYETVLNGNIKYR